jgi:hypothetical protein
MRSYYHQGDERNKREDERRVQGRMEKKYSKIRLI